MAEVASGTNPQDSNLGEFYSQIAATGIISARGLEDLRAKLESGTWPKKSRELASRLVHENWLTEFQAKRILSGRVQELVIGRYTITDRLGSGSMGRVFKAQHQMMGRTVALKVIAPELITNDRVVSRFQREMRLVARLDHPNVVRAFDADRVDEKFFIVMEYVDGKSLGDLLKQGPLSPVEVIRYGSQAAQGLGHAHEQGILHRDVKPSNLLLASDLKIIKVLDLGLGTLMEVDPEESFRTADGIAVGTIDYMSPEQASGKTLDGRSDLYSLACCLYHLMTGRCPFQHENAIKRLALRINTPPIPIRQYIPNLPSKVVSVMERMLATDPADRFQTGAEAAEALQSLLRKKGGKGSSATGSPIRKDTQGSSTGSLEIDEVSPESAENTFLPPSESSQETVPSQQDVNRHGNPALLLDVHRNDLQENVTTTESKKGYGQILKVITMLIAGLMLFVAGFVAGRYF